jgi:hypothetical protein
MQRKQSKKQTKKGGPNGRPTQARSLTSAARFSTPVNHPQHGQPSVNPRRGGPALPIRGFDLGSAQWDSVCQCMFDGESPPSHPNPGAQRPPTDRARRSVRTPWPAGWVGPYVENRTQISRTTNRMRNRPHPGCRGLDSRRRCATLVSPTDANPWTRWVTDGSSWTQQQAGKRHRLGSLGQT